MLGCVFESCTSLYSFNFIHEEMWSMKFFGVFLETFETANMVEWFTDGYVVACVDVLQLTHGAVATVST